MGAPTEMGRQIPVLGQRTHLFIASFLALFVELVLIRWVPSVVHVVGFFANVVLVASFLGLGVGMMGRQANSAHQAAIRLAILVGSLSAYRLAEPTVALATDTTLGINEVTFSGRWIVPLPVVLVMVFALVTWALVPVGRLIAEMFDELPRIPAYTINIAGSLTGVGLFTGVAAAGTSSALWFAIVFAILLTFSRGTPMLISVVAVGIALGAVYFADTNRFAGEVQWTPYNQLRIRPVGDEIDDGFLVDVNNQFLLSGLDLSPGAEPPPGVSPAVASQIATLATYYDFPFQIASPNSALILGAGAGNDIAAAKRANVADITAVEIDGTVAQYGIDHHPEQPHVSANLVIDDARSYLKSSNARFDLVLFATLDAHGLLSASSSIRLDSFIYTVDALRDASDLLTDEGVLVLSFGPFREEVQLRQYAMMEEAFGEPPLYFVHSNDHRMLVAGHIGRIDSLPEGWSLIPKSAVAEGFERHPLAKRLATDDWPQLYLRSPSIPLEYVIALIGMALVGLYAVRDQARQMSRNEVPFFFLGAAFLLMETKSVTEFALLIGSTWQTNALVFSVILAIILLANLTVYRRPDLDERTWITVIVVSLLAHYAWPVSVWPEAGTLKLLAATIYLGVPIFAAGVVFARWFATTRFGALALGVNLLGSVVGGTMEYGSLIFGIRSLALLALGLYLLAFITRHFSSPSGATS